MAETKVRKSSKERVDVSIIDSDIHPTPTYDAIKPYMSERWQRHHETIGVRGHHGYAGGSLYLTYPKSTPAGARVDAWPDSGMPPGSDLSFMQEQHLDALNIEYGILNPYHEVFDQLNDEYAAALAQAINDWQAAEWLAKESRLRSSIIVPYENAELAAAEIDRMGDHPGFVQVLVIVRTREPLGRRKYWKIYEAAERHGLPVGIHFGGIGGNANTPSGWPSYYIEDHTNMVQAFQTQLISLVSEGVFERFPNLRVVLLEGGLTWVPSLMWRLDKHYKHLRDEVPHLKRWPSEYIRDHVWFSTQPIEEPTEPRHFLQVLEQLDSNDKLLFATDYPHWDFDEPGMTFPVRLPKDLEQKVVSENARALYGLDKKA